MSGKVVWVPLESNPDVMTKYIRELGVPDKWQVTDVYGLDDDLLATVPQPVLAVILLFPINEKFKQHYAEQSEQIKAAGQKISEKVYYMKQTISNACGTVALIHCVANNTDRIDLKTGTLKQFIADTVNLDPAGRGEKLESSDDISKVHEESAQEGQTEPNQIQVDYHFVAFVHVDGGLYELDGRKEFPINHGDTNPDSFLKDAARVCREYISKDPEEMRFTVVALTESSS